MTNALMTHRPAFKEGNCQTLSRRSRDWDSIQAQIVERTGLQKEETAIVSNRHLLLLNLKWDSEDGQYWLDGRRAVFTRRKPGALLFIPAGCAWRGWEEGASRAAYLSISIDPAFVSRGHASEERNVFSSVGPDLGFEDDVILHAARAIGVEVDQGSAFGGMFVEGYMTTILAQLMRRTQRVRTLHKGGLPASKLSRIIERIDADISAELTLTELAQEIGLSVPHLCRAFRQSVGCPPHTFIIRRRVERAQAFLRDTKLPLTEIALTCGFGNSSHFSNTFRRIVGTTPMAYRERWAIRASV